eukprot:4385664-Pleurochrysis_carterae.AAC.5
MLARTHVPEPHGPRAHRAHRRHRLHGRRVDRLSFCLSAQVRYVIVECCVAPNDERRNNEEKAAHGV